jgi:hypothetical protein
MSRHRTTPTEAATPPAAAQAPAVHIIDPRGLYFPETFRAVFRLSASSLRRELRQGRLKVYKRCGKYYLIGEQILEWLRGGEVRPRLRSAGGVGGNGHPPPSEGGKA